MGKKIADFKNKPTTRSLRELVRLLMRLSCNRPNADKLCVYESQRIYAAYFREARERPTPVGWGQVWGEWGQVFTFDLFRRISLL